MIELTLQIYKVPQGVHVPQPGNCRYINDCNVTSLKRSIFLETVAGITSLLKLSPGRQTDRNTCKHFQTLV
jgi:hypothetical protein